MISGIAHLVFAMPLAAAAFLGRGPWLVCLYPAASLTAAALAYLSRRPELLGKREDGRRGPGMSALLLPYLGALQVLDALARSGPAWSEVAEGLYLGRMARFDEMPPGIDLVVDVSAERAADPRVVAGRTYLSLPCLGWLPPDPEALRALVDRVVSWPGRVLIYGRRGRGCSAAVTAAVMVRRGLAPDVPEALARLRAVRPGVHPSRAQLRAAEAAVRPDSGGRPPSGESVMPPAAV